MKTPVTLMLLLLAASLLAQPQALTIMQAALMDEWQVRPGAIALFRLLRILAPFIIGLWIIWRRKATGWERARLHGLMFAGGVLAVLSLQVG